MASNVFGTPITDETLMSLPEYQDDNTITSSAKAKVALLMKNAGGKDTSARQYLDTVLARADVERGRYAMCLIYNAIGDAIEFVKARSCEGALLETPYPLIIENGQWGAFLHGPWKGGENESKGGVVYQGKNGNGSTYHFLLSWYCHQTKNRVYVETRYPGHYDDDGTWTVLDDLLTNSDPVHKEKWNGCFLMGSIGDSAVHNSFETIITLRD